MAELLSCGHEVLDAEQPHYCTYLRLDNLLNLQPRAEKLRHADEHLFVIAHQSFELWFNEILFELERAIELIQADETWRAAALVRRVATIVSWFPQQQGILETMLPPDFFQFRGALVPASGLESQQFREIEILSGLRNPDYRRFLEQPVGPGPKESKVNAWTDRLTRRWEQRSLWEAFLALLDRRDARPLDLYVRSEQPNPHRDLFTLAEALVDYDEAFSVWRFTHARLAERLVGGEVEGTGETGGVSYLDIVANKRMHFFPELWNARSELWRRMEEPPLET